MEVRKVLIKRNLMRQLEEKCQIMDTGVQKFFTKLEPLYKKGISNLLVITDKLSRWSDYSEKIMTKARDSSKVATGRFSMIGKVFLEALAYDLDIQYEIKNLFITKPTFDKYIEVDEMYKNLLKMTIAIEQERDKLCELLE